MAKKNMTTSDDLALVVDDEPALRNLITRSLRAEGFSCDQAGNGLEAIEKLKRFDYDVIVTDLRMPGAHGHALACDVLERPQRPVLIVLTSYGEPKLIKDLMARGVDDVMFKPVDLQAFASKVRALVSRRARQSESHRPASTKSAESVKVSETAEYQPRSMSPTEYEQKLLNVQQILPLSSTALDAFHLAHSGDQDAGAMATLVLRDGVLTAELLRLANSAFYNPSATPVLNVRDAIIRIGFRRVGAVALATGARGALTNSVVPWLNTDLMWSRSMAAVIAAAHLEAQGSHHGIGDGAFLGALMHPLGRIVFGLQFPKCYERLMKEVHDNTLPLRDLELLAFPETHSAALARVLTSWRLPADILQPLRYVADRFENVQHVREPMRLQAELLKVSIVIARLAVAVWEPWDLVEFPSDETLDRLRVRDVDVIVQSTRDDLRRIVGSRANAPGNAEKLPPRETPAKICGTVRYCNLSQNRFDFIRSLLTGLGYEIEEVPYDMQEIGADVVVNCLATPALRLKAQAWTSASKSRRLLIVDDPNSPLDYQAFGETISLPISNGTFVSAIQRYAKKPAAGTASSRSSAAT